MTWTTWRSYAGPIIRKVLEKTKGLSEKEIRKALHDAYPFGHRSQWPYKVWCDEIKRQRGRVKQHPLFEQDEL
jgi:hypothetical protein